MAQDEIVTITLKRNDVGQILDGLEERKRVWGNTAEYLENGTVICDGMIEDCHDGEEALYIAHWYGRIIGDIWSQLKEQIS